MLPTCSHLTNSGSVTSSGPWLGHSGSAVCTFPAVRLLASFLFLPFDSWLPWGLTETGLAPVICFQRHRQKSARDAIHIWWRWPQVNWTDHFDSWSDSSISDQTSSSNHRWKLYLFQKWVKKKFIFGFFFFPSNFLPLSFPSALTLLNPFFLSPLSLSLVWQCYCMHINGESYTVTFVIYFEGFRFSQSTFHWLKFRCALFFLFQFLNTWLNWDTQQGSLKTFKHCESFGFNQNPSHWWTFLRQVKYSDTSLEVFYMPQKVSVEWTGLISC